MVDTLPWDKRNKTLRDVPLLEKNPLRCGNSCASRRCWLFSSNRTPRLCWTSFRTGEASKVTDIFTRRNDWMENTDHAPIFFHTFLPMMPGVLRCSPVGPVLHAHVHQQCFTLHASKINKLWGVGFSRRCPALPLPERSENNRIRNKNRCTSCVEMSRCGRRVERIRRNRCSAKPGDICSVM